MAAIDQYDAAGGESGNLEIRETTMSKKLKMEKWLIF
jgi:hypothetical protein